MPDPRPASATAPRTLSRKARSGFALTSALRPGGPINDHVARHGDGVRSVAFSTPDARTAFRHVVARGAVPVLEPVCVEDRGAAAVLATVAAYGDTTHTFVERAGANGIWLPGFTRWESPAHAASPAGLVAIDHCVANVGWGEMERWCRYYADAFDFEELVSFDDRDISTEYTALRSKVMRNRTGTVKLPINEPARGRKRSQIEEYLDSYGGPGVQHVAIATADIVATVRALQANGVELLTTPASYYDNLARARRRHRRRRRDAPGVEHPGRPRRRGLHAADLHQAAARPPDAVLRDHPAPRRAPFGKGNFKALFVSIEKEQARRGNL